jgi:amino acid transporter
MSFIGAGVKDAYLTLLDMAVVLQMLSYLYLFAALLAVARRSKTSGAYLGRKKLWFAAVSGLAATTIGLIVAFIPSHQINSIWIFESKMVICCTVFLGIAGALFRYYSRRRLSVPPIIAPSSAT